jgi:hypothetical protein
MAQQSEIDYFKVAMAQLQSERDYFELAMARLQGERDKAQLDKDFLIFHVQTLRCYFRSIRDDCFVLHLV